MPCEQKPDRVDPATGRARAGSQKQLQTYVNYKQDDLSQKVLERLNPPPGPSAKLRWVSPLKEEHFNEYRDAEFLEKLGLSDHSIALKEFWPDRGPCWDALAQVTGCSPEGIVLVEAKSHVSELGSSCDARSAASRAKIEASLACTKRRLGVNTSKDWMNNYYQSANRYAHLFFLRDLGVHAWLVNVYFLDDCSIDAPATEAEWRVALEEVKERMGLSGKSVPFASELFLEAESTYQGDVPREFK